MAIDIVQKPPDIRPSEDWRARLVAEGVKVFEHTGKTALTDVQWLQLSEGSGPWWWRRKRGTFIVEERTAHTTPPLTLMDREQPSRLAALADVEHRIELSPAAFDPYGPIRIVVMEVFR